MIDTLLKEGRKENMDLPANVAYLHKILGKVLVGLSRL